MIHNGQWFSLGPFRANGYSVGSRVSWLAIPALDVIFDMGWCVEPMRQITRAFISHLHIDHALGLPTWLCWRHSFLSEDGEAEVYVHESMVEKARALIEAQREAQSYFFSYKLIGLGEGEQVDIGRDRFVEVFETSHYLPTLGFLVKERRRHLKEEYRGFSGAEIRELRESGLDIHDRVSVPLLCYTSDTCPDLFDRRPDLLESPVLVTECSYLDGTMEYDLADESRLGEKEVTHCHVRPLMRRLKNFRGKTLALCHLPITYQGCDLEPFLWPRMPAHLRDKLLLLPYQDGVERPPHEQQEPSPQPVYSGLLRWQEIDRGLWESKERVPYFGSRKRELVADIELRHGDFRIAYEWEGALIERESALQLYEDAYYFFLSRQRELLDWLVRTACDVYDTEPENVESGLDYGAQDPGKPSHLHDIAVRRVLCRLGRWFEGRDLLEIRGVRSRAYVLNPGLVPFHRRPCIVEPQWCSRWALAGSVESFWQSNKVVVVAVKAGEMDTGAGVKC
jgi:ribonuclease Z